MAQKPDGKAAKTERVTFTRPAAERIAKVVRAFEAGDRSQSPLSFGHRPAEQAKTFRICTFTGAWSISSSKTVTFKYQTTTPNTVSATNLFLPIGDTGNTRDCAIARDGSAWFLVQSQWEPISLVSDATLTTAAIEFTRYAGGHLGTASTVQIAVTACTTG